MVTIKDGTKLTVVFSHVNPPIPIRNNDWCVYEDGEEEGGRYGWGKTKWEAFHNFVETLEDHE